MTDTIEQQDDPQRFTARQVVQVLNLLGTLDAVTLIERGYVDVSKVLSDILPKQWTVTLSLLGEKKIGAIKIIREHSMNNGAVYGENGYMGLADAKRLVDAVRDGIPTVVLTTDSFVAARKMLRDLSANGSTASVQGVIG